MTVVALARAGVSACAAALLAAGCGGGGSGSPPTDRGRVAATAFTAPPPRTVLSAGALEFTVESSAGLQVGCTLNGAPAAPCLAGDATGSGRIDYRDLEPGLHRFVLEVGGTATGRTEHVLEVVLPDVVVFGATPGGIAAAVAAAESAKSVAILEPTRWVGGVISGGLAKTDTGPKGHEIIGGFAERFFARVRAAEDAKGACAGRCLNAYDVEPREAERAFEAMLAEARVIVERSVELLGVAKDGTTLVSAATSRGEVRARLFIDASYEGDLMARAGIPYALGREPRFVADPPDDPAGLALQEDHAGVRLYQLPRGVHVDPYRIPGDPSSGPLPFVEPRPASIPPTGSGDSRVMAYTYRLCVTDDPSNRLPFEAPQGYDPQIYEASGRLTEAWVRARGVDPAVAMFNPAQTVVSASGAHFKYDLNGGSTFSIDMTAPHLNQAYVEADEVEREQIRAAYRDYIRGLLYFWQTDPRFGALNDKIARFGYCKDEFADRGGWPHQLYVRAARRMQGEYLMNQNDVFRNGRRPPIEDSVGFGSYNLDMHTYRYLAAPVTWPDGTRRDALVNEGFLIAHAATDDPYPVSYRALVPRAEDATNFLNPVTLSATNVAYSSLRMEPTFMILGEAAGVAAALAIESGQSVQRVSYAELRRRLLARGARLDR